MESVFEVEQEHAIVTTPPSKPKKTLTLPPILNVPRVAVPQLFTQQTVAPPVKPIVNLQRTVDDYHFPGNKRTALVIVAYNRPAYLERTLNSIIDTLSSPRNSVLVDIVLSQDGFLPVLNPVVEKMKKRIETSLPRFNFTHIHHTQVLPSLSFLA